jgi:uncharacterized protein (DUF1501 family)
MPRSVPDLHAQASSRRAFLRHAAALSVATGGVGVPLALQLAAMGSASAQTSSNYRALVCLFMFGGNDAYNMVLPTDTDSWANYTATRLQTPESIALLSPGSAAQLTAPLGSPARLGGVLPLQALNAQGRSYALHPSMGTLQTLFNTDKRLAIVPNVGPLKAPTTKAQYKIPAHPKPENLFSHNDQQNTWLSFAPEGATNGWGGRMGDLLMACNSRAQFTTISAAGNTVWLNGGAVRQYQVSARGPIRPGRRTGETDPIFNSPVLQATMERVIGTARSNHVFEKDLAAVGKRSLDAELILRGALAGESDARWATPGPSGHYEPAADPLLGFANPSSGGSSVFNTTAHQLQVVARLVEAAMSSRVDVTRQIFFVTVDGFDTHDRQNASHATKMAQVAHALSYFDTVLGNVGARNNVTVFTASDFGRTFVSNGDGTDHGWGAHHFVMGGAVKGGDIHGRFPVLGTKNPANIEFDSSPDQLQNGVLLPEIAVDQVGSTLGSWMGLSDTQLLDIYPNLSKFDASKRKLGFMA